MERAIKQSEANDMDAVKRLLVLLLIKLGSTSDEIGGALGVDASVVRRMVPAARIKKILLPPAEG